MTSSTASGANSATTSPMRPASPLPLYLAIRSRIDSLATSSQCSMPPYSLAVADLLEAPTVWELVRRRGELTPDQPMLIDATDRTLTFGEFAARAERVAAGLQALGVKPGTRVTWQLPTRIESAPVAMALALLGAVQNPIIHLYREREVGAVMRQSQPEFFIVPGQWRDRDFGAMAKALSADLHNAPNVVVVQDEEVPDGDPSSLPAA